MEVKLKLIENFVHLMDFEAILRLLDALDSLVSQNSTANSFLFCNQHIILISFIMYEIAEKINQNAPRLHTCILKLQKDIMDQIFTSQEAFWTDHLAMAHYLKQRDFTGRSSLHLLLETKVYEIMQIPVIEQVIKSLWLGKQNFGGKFM